MNRAHYHFTRMTLVRSEGFDQPPFLPIENFGPGLNIITGPNGIGKSTLLRAMRSLLHGTNISAKMHAQATVAQLEQQWELSLVHGELLQRKRGHSESQHLPGRNHELSDTYFFALHELLDQAGDTQVFIERVRKEMHGGIDLAKAYTDSKAATGFSGANLGLKRAVDVARDKLRAAQSKIDIHADIRDHIAQLEEHIDTAGMLRQEQQLYSNAIEAVQTQQKLTDLHEEIVAFDSRITHLHAGTEAEYRSLLDRVDQEQREVDAQKQRVAEKERQIASHQLAAELSSDMLWRKELSRLIAALITQEQERKQSQREFAEAEARFTASSDELTWLVTELPKESFLQPALKELAQLAGESERVRLAVVVAERLLASLGVYDDNCEAAYAHAKQELDAVAPLVSGTAQRSGLRVRNLIGLLVILAGGVGSLLWAPLGLTVTVVVALLLFLFQGKKPKSKSTSLIDELSLREGIDLSDTQKVEKLYQLLLRREADLAHRKERNIQIKSAEQEVQRTQVAYQRWRSEYQAAAASLNLQDHPSIEQANFFNFSKALLEWQRHGEVLRAKEACYRSAEAQYLKTKTALLAHGRFTDNEHAILLEDAQSLLAEIAEYERAEQDLERLLLELERDEKRFATAEEAVATFYTKLDISQEDPKFLWRLIADFPTYEGLVRERESVTVMFERIESDAIAKAETASLHELQAHKRKIEEELEEIEKHREKLGELKETYRGLTQSSEIADLDRTWRNEVEELEEHRSKEVTAVFIDALFNEAQEASQRQHQPEVVRNASKWFEAITHNQYRLLVADGSFVAEESATNQTKQLRELSSGTRIQLLFSIRMGFLDLLEKGTEARLPLFFDEIMANSDDERSLAIAEAIKEITQTRQVFYATAQVDEVHKLQSVVKDAVVIDLGVLAGKKRSTTSPFVPSTYQVDSVPVAIEDYDQYAEVLSVYAPQLFEPIGSLHPWYLATSSTELYTLLNRNFTTAGQAALSSPLYRRRVALLRAAQRAMQQGRPRILREADLLEVPAEVRRNTQYWQQIVDFLAAENRTGNDLVAAIENKEIQRLQDPARAVLLDWLQRERFTSEGSPLSEAEILAAVSLSDEAFTTDSCEHMIVLRYLAALGLGTI